MKETTLRGSNSNLEFQPAPILDTPLICVYSNQFSIFLWEILHQQTSNIYRTFCLIRILKNGCRHVQIRIYDLAVSRTIHCSACFGIRLTKKGNLLIYMFSTPFFNLNSTVIVIIYVCGCLFRKVFTFNLYKTCYTCLGPVFWYKFNDGACFG